MKIEATPVFEKIYDFWDDDIFQTISLQGGSRSSKTWSIIQMLIVYCTNHKDGGKIINIFRSKLTWCKDSVLVDFIYILNQYDIDYDLNKSSSIIELYGNIITFKGLDDEQRLKGLRQDICWLNETTDTNKDHYDQLALRTSDKIIFDYNPNTTIHYVYDLNSQNFNNDNYLYFVSVPLDNPYLDKSTRDLINSWKPTQENIILGTVNENKYKIYGLGMKGSYEGLVFPTVKWIEEFPSHIDYNYAIDFGFVNDETALVKCGYKGNDIYIELLCYEKGLTTDDINIIFKSHTSRLSYGDSAEARLINELAFKHKVKIRPVKKTTILSSIDLLHNYNIHIVEHSKARIEQENYTYKKFNGEYINEPIDKYNHMWDAIRYYAIMELSSLVPKNRKLKISF